VRATSGTCRPVVQPVSAVRVRADLLQASAHEGVVLQYPGELALRYALRRTLPPVVQVHELRHAHLPVRFQYAECEYTHGVYLAPVPQRPGPAEREETPVHVPQNTVHVGQRQRKARQLSLHLREQHEVRVHHWLELLRHVMQLFVRHGHVPPVTRPGLVVNHANTLHLLLELLHVHAADNHAETLRDGVASTHQTLGRRLRLSLVAQVVRHEILRLHESAALEEIGIPGRIPRHHDHGRTLETADQESAFLVERQARGAAHHLHPSCGKPLRRGIQQLSCGTLVTLALEHSEKAYRLAVLLQVATVLDGGNTPHHAPLRIARNEKLYSGMPVKGMPRGVNELVNITPERRHPPGVTGVQPVRKLHELPSLTLRPHRVNTHFTAACITRHESPAQISPASRPHLWNVSSTSSSCSLVCVAM